MSDPERDAQDPREEDPRGEGPRDGGSQEEGSREEGSRADASHAEGRPRRSPDEPARDPRRGLHPVVLVICILLFVFLFFLIRDVRTQYVGEYGSQESAPAPIGQLAQEH